MSISMYSNKTVATKQLPVDDTLVTDKTIDDPDNLLVPKVKNLTEKWEDVTPEDSLPPLLPISSLLPLPLPPISSLLPLNNHLVSRSWSQVLTNNTPTTSPCSSQYSHVVPPVPLFHTSCSIEHENKTENYSKLVVPQPPTVISKESVTDNNDITETDTDETLVLYGYTNCNNYSSPAIQQSKGLIFDGDTLVSRGLSFTQEYDSTKEDDDIEETLSQFEWDDIRFFRTEEGSAVRMFYYNDKWYISTYRKLDAFRSKWSSNKSFGEMFSDGLDNMYANNESFKNLLNNEVIDENQSVLNKFKNTLDRTLQYIFLIRNDEQNRIVCDAPAEQKIFLVGTMDRTTWKLNVDATCGFIERLEKCVYANLDEMFNDVDNVSHWDHPGVIAFLPNGGQFKITNTDYMHYFKVRGNTPSIKYRYLQLRCDCNEIYLQHLDKMYPNSRDDFDAYEDAIGKVSDDIYKAYVSRFIKKNYVSVPQEQYTVVKEIHNWYLLDRKNHRVTRKKVETLVSHQTPTNLNRIIKNWIRNSTLPKETKEQRNCIQKEKNRTYLQNSGQYVNNQQQQQHQYFQQQRRHYQDYENRRYQQQ
jgi:hypothetical protein